MKLSRLLSPLLLIIMIASQLAPALESASLSAAPVETLTSEADQPLASFLVQEPQGEQSVELVIGTGSDQTIASSFQSEFSPAILSADVRPRGDTMLVIPTILNEDTWPDVQVSVLNPNAFWVAFDPSLSSPVNFTPNNMWAEGFVIPPGQEALYTLHFSDTEDSTVQLRFDASGLLMSNSGMPGGGAYSLLDFLLTFGTAGFVNVERILTFLMSEGGGASPAETIAALFETADCDAVMGRGIPGAGMWGKVQDVYRCLTSPSVHVATQALIKKTGSNAKLERLGSILSHVNELSSLVTMLWQLGSAGTYVATVTFRSTLVEFGRVKVSQVDEDGNPVIGGCYRVHPASEAERDLGSACDGDDGNQDGSILISVRQGDGAVLQHTAAPSGFLAAPDTDVTLRQYQTVEVSIELEKGSGFTVYVVDEENTALSGACFQIVPLTGGNPLERCDGHGEKYDGVVDFGTLPEGQYTLTQTETPFNHKVAEDMEVTLVKGTPKSVTVVNPYTEFGSLVINLRGENGALPVGSCFNVFNTDQNPRQFTARLCDNGSGVLSIDELKLGNYVLEQIDMATGYAPIHPREFAIAGGQQTVLDVLVLREGILEIRHVDEYSTPVGFACFEVTETYTDIFGTSTGESAQECDLDGNGVVIFEHLRPGEYSVEHVRGDWENRWIITTHARASAGSVQVAPATTTTLDMVSNTTVDVVVNTQDQGGNAVTGACYEVDPDDPYPLFGGQYDPGPIACDEDDGNLDGVTTIAHVPPGTYELRADYSWEPNDYHHYPEPQAVELPVSAGEYRVTKQVLAAGSLRVTTEDEVTGTTVDHYYELRKNEGGNPGEIVGLGIRGDGSSVHGHILPGEYFLDSREPGVPDTPVTIVAGRENHVTVRVKPNTPVFRIETVNQNGEFLPGACYRAESGFRDYAACDADDGSSDGVTFIRVPAEWATYAVWQSVTPAGQLVAAAQIVSVRLDAPDNTIDLTFDSSVAGGSLTIVTEDGETGEPVYACYHLRLPSQGTSQGTFILSGVCSTEVNGESVVRIDGLPAGEFELHQDDVRAEEDQVVEHPQITVSIAAGEQKSITVQNEPWPTPVFHSKHPNGDPLLGACYQMTVSGGTISACDGDDGATDGIVTFGQRFKPQYMRFTGNAPQEYGYGAYNSYIPIRAGTMPIVVQYSAAGTIVISFVDSTTGQTVQDGSLCWSLEITRIDPYEMGAPVDCHNKLRHSLDPGRYYVSVNVDESNSNYLAENGYSQSFEVTIEEGTETRLEVNVFVKPSVIIQNRDAAGNSVPGACYRLFQYTSWDVLYSCDTDNDGVVVFPYVYPYSYRLEDASMYNDFGNYLPIDDIDLFVENKPGDMVLTIDRLRAGSVNFMLPTPRDYPLCYEIWQILPSGQLGSLVQPSDCMPTYTQASRVDQMPPGRYLARVTSPTQPSFTDTPFTIAEGQVTSLVLGASSGESSPVFTLHIPDTIQAGATVPVTVNAHNATGGATNLNGYTYSYACGYSAAFGPRTASPTSTCSFSTASWQTVRVKVYLPDGTELTTLSAVIVVTAAPIGTPVLTLSPTEARAGSSVTVSGEGYGANDTVDIRWGSSDGDLLTTAEASDQGTFAVSLNVPSDAVAGEQQVFAVGQTSTTTVSATLTVLPTPEFAISPPAQEPGWTVRLTGTGFAPNEDLEIRWGEDNGQIIGTAEATAEGAIDIQVTIPANAILGTASIYVVGSSSRASAEFTVTPLSLPTLRLTPNTGPSGQYTAVYGTGFWPGETVEIRWQSETGIVIGRLKVRPDGTYLGRITTRVGPPGSNRVYALGTTSDKRTMAWYQIISSEPDMSLTTNRNLTQSGEVITIRGSGYQPGEMVEIRWISQTGTLLGRVQATSTGTISGSIRIPQGTNRNYQIFATGTTSRRYASVVHQVRNYMLAGSARVSPSSGGTLKVVTVTGNGMAANETVQIRWGSLTGPVVGTGTAAADGTYAISVTTPSSGPGVFDLVSVGTTSYRYHFATYTVTADTTTAKLNVSHTTIAPGNVILTNGTGWVPNEQVDLRWNGPDGRLLGRLTVRPDGTWSGRITIPTTATAGSYHLYAIAPSGFKSVLMTVSMTSRSSMSVTIATPVPTATPKMIGTPVASPDAPVGTPQVVPTDEVMGTPSAMPTEDIAGTPDVVPTEAPILEPTIEPTQDLVVDPETIAVFDQYGTPIVDVCINVLGPNGELIARACDVSSDMLYDAVPDGHVRMPLDLPAGEYRIEVTSLPPDIDKPEIRPYHLNGADLMDLRIDVNRQQPTPVPTATPEPTPVPTPTPEPPPVPTPTPEPSVAPPPDAAPDPAAEPASTPAA